ncbi:MAG TPA: NADH-quinone oxidoreductase subunit C [Longimicrobiaceae bacterium]|nr:NADH-quinone oxidoreductase subunit C [Longimicrobiaceae bacterium]
MTDNSFKKGLDDLESGAGAAPKETPGVPPPAGGIPAHPSIDGLRAEFGDIVGRHELVAGDEHIVYLPADRSREVLAWLRDSPDNKYDFLQDLTAVDYGGGQPIQVVYQLWSMDNKRQLRVKVELPLDQLEIGSVYHLWRAADWMEREVYDMFGVVFNGHPDLRRILMPFNYAEGHPLRKDFPLRGRFTRAEQTRRALAMKTEDHYSPEEMEHAEKLGQPLPEVTVEGGPGVPNVGMPGVGGH